MGPVIYILLLQALTEDQRKELERWLYAHTSDCEGQQRGEWSFVIRDGRLIGLPFEDCPAPCVCGLSIEKAQTIEDFRKPDGSVDEAIMTEMRAEEQQLLEYLGYLPQQHLVLDIGCNRPTDHQVLAQLAVLLAERYDGFVQLNGALTPRLKPGQHWDEMTVEEVEDYVRDLRLPGHIFNMYYETARDTSWVSHVVDSAFLRAWLQHPDFHLIK